MPSFQLTITPKRRAAGRYLSEVRREFQKAFAVEAQAGLTQSEIARRLDVHRSVINREFKGTRDITPSRVGELAWAMGYRPIFQLEKVRDGVGANATIVAPVGGGAGASVAKTAEVKAGEWGDTPSTVTIHRLVKPVE